MAAEEMRRYPYDLDEPYRQGEADLLRSMVKMASARGTKVILVPLALYGYNVDIAELLVNVAAFPGDPTVLDLYAQLPADVSKFWHDDAHVEPVPAGALMTAVLAQYLLDAGVLGVGAPKSKHD